MVFTQGVSCLMIAPPSNKIEHLIGHVILMTPQLCPTNIFIVYKYTGGSTNTQQIDLGVPH